MKLSEMYGPERPKSRRTVTCSTVAFKQRFISIPTFDRASESESYQLITRDSAADLFSKAIP